MRELTARLLTASEGGAPVVAVTIIEAGPTALAPGTKLLVEPDGRTLGSLGDAVLDALVTRYAAGAFARHAAETLYLEGEQLSPRMAPAAAALYLEVVEARPTLLVVGAGHIGRQLAKLGRFLDYYVGIIDDREEFADPEKVPEADEVICEEFGPAIDAFPINSNTAVVMVTRGHKQDELSLRRALGRGAGYVGMIGSKRRSAAVLEHLRSEGLPGAELDAVRTPIGLDIGAETPEEIAVSIMAEIIMFRRGGDSAPMYYRRGRPE